MYNTFFWKQYSGIRALCLKMALVLLKNRIGIVRIDILIPVPAAAVAQSVRAFVSQAEGWVFEFKPRHI